MSIYIDDNFIDKDIYQSDNINLSTDFIVLKPLAKKYGLKASCLLGYFIELHLRKYNHLNQVNDYELETNTIADSLYLTDYNKRKQLDILVKSGIIDKARIGIPCKSFCRINFYNLHKELLESNCYQDYNEHFKLYLKMEKPTKYFNEEKKKEKKQSYNLRYVYAMKNYRNGYIKIGYSSNPNVREKTLQSEEPEVEILFFYKGTSEDEIFLHDYFKDKRLRGEWFDLEEDDLTFIENYLKNLNY